MSFRSGFVAVLGRPNVGKSTLMNALLKQKIAAVSPRPQTTRRKQLGILTIPEAQVIFIDTPGVHQPKHKLGQKMNEAARETLTDADLILWLVDASAPLDDEDRLLADWIVATNRVRATLLVLNKIDLISPEELAGSTAAYQALLPGVEVFPISAARGDHCSDLLERILARLPEGEAYYPEDQVTDLFEREIATDLIREAALINLREEVPHGIAIRIDEYKDRDEGTAYIAATLFVERESHKGIVIGQGGSMIKLLGASARKEIEALTGRKVFLELRVKVAKNWRDDETALQHFGFTA
ncbi:MAG: GTPase Era [Chloroflexota bacterium]